MKFTKMQGCGNDYVYVDGSREIIEESKKPELVRALSDRHFGIGGDGVIFILPSSEADFEMQMFNMDGTRAGMCGNGIRCVAKFVYDKGLTDQTTIRIISEGKINTLMLTVENNLVTQVRVNMGAPILQASDIPVVAKQAEDGSVISAPIEVEGQTYHMTCVSMGNPHAVIFVDEVLKDMPDDAMMQHLGPIFEHHTCFPKRVNTEFIKVIDREHIEMRVWERGTGETLACGTGACAAAVACILNGRTGNRVFVKLLGGELLIEWAGKGTPGKEDAPVFMTGPAATVFEGEIDLTKRM